MQYSDKHIGCNDVNLDVQLKVVHQKDVNQETEVLKEDNWMGAVMDARTLFINQSIIMEIHCDYTIIECAEIYIIPD